tara:strand:- start:3277 stop:3630 length:354 start_codon:yes stop_codon:yes gene_type:complete
MDQVFIEKLSVDAVIGIHDWEKKIRQTLLIDLVMKWDNQLAGTTDNYQHALCYDRISRCIQSFVAQHPMELIETVAEKVAELVQLEFCVQAVEVTVRKPTAIADAQAVGVRIKRGVW